MISKKEVISIISKALNVSNKKIKVTSSSKDIEEWDSLGQLNIMMSLDKKLKGKILKISSISEAYSVQKIIKILEKNKLVK
tara:strand:- start:260 stop:502 length:243 start_codon:yes stop_codon:yes gene_type:complete